MHPQAQVIEANAIRGGQQWASGRLIRSWLQNINHQTVNAPGMRLWAAGRWAIGPSRAAARFWQLDRQRHGWRAVFTFGGPVV
jgi:hypothetical protein